MDVIEKLKFLRNHQKKWGGGGGGSGLCRGGGGGGGGGGGSRVGGEGHGEQNVNEELKFL